MTAPIRIGISACLLGQRVRYDGQHKLDPFLADTLGRYVEYVPVCPEVECGLPVPREPMRLVGDPEAPRLLTRETGRDLTEQMLSWAGRRVKALARENLCGFIFKSKSPSSGMERVKIYNARGGIAGSGSGLFAREFMRAFPLLPVEDEGRLHDLGLRENFIERLFALHRYRTTVGASRSLAALAEYQARHKLLLMAHSEMLARAMGRLAAQAKGADRSTVLAEYERLLLQALARPATTSRHVNVLQHMMGYFKNVLTPDEKRELLGIIGDFQNGLVPLLGPLTLLSHYVRKYRVGYLQDQWYLAPHPLELQLRNHA